MAFVELGKDIFANLGGTDDAPFYPRRPNPETSQTKKALVTDAVRAAVKVMNRMDSTPTGVMGDEVGGVFKENMKETDMLLCTASRVARSNPGGVGAIRLIRLGLLMDDWLAFRQRLCALAMIAETMAQELVSYRQRAYAMADEISISSRNGRMAFTRSPYNRIPWKPLLIGVGIFTIGAFGWRLWKSRQESKSSQMND